MATDDRDTVRREFGEAVDMPPAEPEEWPATEEAQAVGRKDGGGESTGHESGRRIVALLHTRVALLRTRKDELTDDDLEHMRRVRGYVRRHLAQRPVKEDVETSRRRYSLLNRGHDPLKNG